jgi:2-keto-4-pentenoate hydratase/2-oxohepta-3-ene-1,7-dioic acid hydratase in catechol pathway
MKIAVFNDNRLGIVQNDRITDVTNSVPWNKENVQESLVQLMGSFNEWKPKMEEALASSDTYAVKEIKLQAPVPNPSKLLAAPVNYLNHQDEMNAQFNNAEFTVEKLGLFLKAPSSIIGPDETVLLPYKDRRHDHEAELAFVVGKEAKNVKASEASNYIFGYFSLMDITVRGKEERTWRKSFDTFTPIGPWIVTADEVGNPHNLHMDLWVNEESRQSANTKDLIYDCYKCFEIASHTMTLYPGDIITTGTPEGVGPITKGDQVRIQIERIGEFTVHVDFKEDVS